MTIDSLVKIRHENKKFIVEGKPIGVNPVPKDIMRELQAQVDAVKWPQECANCGRPVQKTDTLIESTSFKGIGAVAVSVKGIPYCEVCYPMIKRAQNLYFVQLMLTFLFGIALSIYFIKTQAESASTFIFCGGMILLGFAIGYGLAWLLMKLIATLFMQNKIAEPVKGKLIQEEKTGGNSLVNLVLTIPNEGYSAKFAQLNGIH